MKKLLLVVIIMSTVMNCTPDTEYIDKIEYIDRIVYVDVIETETVYEEVVVYETIRDTVYIDNIIYVYQELPKYIYDVRSVQAKSYTKVINQLNYGITDYPYKAVEDSNNLSNGDELNYFNVVEVKFENDVLDAYSTETSIWLYIEPGTHIETLIIDNPMLPAWYPYDFIINTFDFTIGEIVFKPKEDQTVDSMLFRLYDSYDSLNMTTTEKSIVEFIGNYSHEDLYGYTYSDISYDVGQFIIINGAMYEIMNKALIEH